MVKYKKIRNTNIIKDSKFLNTEGGCALVYQGSGMIHCAAHGATFRMYSFIFFIENFCFKWQAAIKNAIRD